MVRDNRYVMTSLDTARLNESFDLLTHPYRRYTLYYLTTESEVVDIDALATAIATWDEDRRADGGADSKAVTVALHHCHLPKLADAGLIAFDAKTGTIELEETDGIDRFLDDTVRIDGYAQPVADD